MTTYTTIPDTDVDVDSPVTQQLMERMRDNPLAIAEGDATAPKVAFNALRFQDYTSGSNSFNTSSVSYVFVELWGAGGSGSQDASNNGGGGQGGYISGYIDTTSLSSITANVGAGGAGVGSGDGNDGGLSEISGLLIAYGGLGGTNLAGGSGSSGSTVFQSTTQVIEVNAWLGASGNFGTQAYVGGGLGQFNKSNTSNSAQTMPNAIGSGSFGRSSGSSLAGNNGLIRIWY